MTFLALVLPLFLFYALWLVSLGTGLLACAGAFLSRRRRRWVLVASLLAILAGVGLNLHYQALLWSAAGEAWWFTLSGLAPIPLGAAGLGRWLLQK
ncbi:MAG: hypothetical protein VKI82_12875 [Leptolyngbya sp.]|nr:hypothetical protein [Leptolyngbya sp.]